MRCWAILVLLCGLSCGKSEWCDRLVETACDCEARTESDLCQDAEVIANREDEDSCEERYYGLPGECRPDSSSSGLPGSGSGSGSGSVECELPSECNEWLDAFCSCPCVDSEFCVKETKRVEDQVAYWCDERGDSNIEPAQYAFCSTGLELLAINNFSCCGALSVGTTVCESPSVYGVEGIEVLPDPESYCD